jgi:hypothetical protein
MRNVGPTNYFPPKVAEIMGRILHDLGFDTCECVQGGLHGHSWRTALRDHPYSALFRMLYAIVLAFNGSILWTLSAEDLAKWEAVAVMLDAVPAGSPFPEQALDKLSGGLGTFTCINPCECGSGGGGPVLANPLGWLINVLECAFTAVQGYSPR